MGYKEKPNHSANDFGRSNKGQLVFSNMKMQKRLGFQSCDMHVVHFYIYLSLCEIKINFASIQLDRIINPSKHSREPKLLKEDVRRNQTYVLQMDMEGSDLTSWRRCRHLTATQILSKNLIKTLNISSSSPNFYDLTPTIYYV